MEENKLPVTIQTDSDIANLIIQEQDLSKVVDLTKLFKATAVKKEVLRVVKLNELLNKIEDGVIDRFNKTDLITNSELLDFYKVVQTSIDRSNKLLSEVNSTSLPTNNMIQNINILNLNSEETPKKSKSEIAKAFLAIMAKAKEDNIVTEQEIIEVKEELTETETYIKEDFDE